MALADAGIITREGDDLAPVLRFLGEQLSAIGVVTVETVQLTARFIETEGAENFDSMVRDMSSAWNWNRFSAARLGNVLDLESTHTVRINAQDVNVQVGPVKREQLTGLLYPPGTPPRDSLPELAWLIGMVQVAPRTIRREWRHVRDSILHVVHDWETHLQQAWRNVAQ